MRCVVCLESSTYPFRGYILTAKRVPESDEYVWDSLSPDLAGHVFVEAENIDQAKAIGLKKLVEETKDGRSAARFASLRTNACTVIGLSSCSEL